MAIIKIEELNAVSELTAAELSLTKGGHHDECCGSLITVTDPDVVDNKWGYLTINDDGNINGPLSILVEVEDSFNGNKFILW
ncbi:MAG: hypothetical protein HC866_08305 [Leptolyngbyaceae cyanobacterium RU_5_1]|nr:hypothetical protein [Leptolyngbyaceae cyanobacterium RU_5_1]